MAVRRALLLAPMEDSNAVVQEPIFCPIIIGTALPKVMAPVPAEGLEDTHAGAGALHDGGQQGASQNAQKGWTDVQRAGGTKPHAPEAPWRWTYYPCRSSEGQSQSGSSRRPFSASRFAEGIQNNPKESKNGAEVCRLQHLNQQPCTLHAVQAENPRCDGGTHIGA